MSLITFADIYPIYNAIKRDIVFESSLAYQLNYVICRLPLGKNFLNKNPVTLERCSMYERK